MNMVRRHIRRRPTQFEMLSNVMQQLRKDHKKTTFLSSDVLKKFKEMYPKLAPTRNLGTVLRAWQISLEIEPSDVVVRVEELSGGVYKPAVWKWST